MNVDFLWVFLQVAQLWRDIMDIRLSFGSFEVRAGGLVFYALAGGIVLHYIGKWIDI